MSALDATLSEFYFGALVGQAQTAVVSLVHSTQCCELPQVSFGGCPALVNSRLSAWASILSVEPLPPQSWQAMAGLICLRRGRGGARYGLEVGRNIAAQRGGQLLSEHYANSRQPLQWECSQGHMWKARLYAVKNQTTWWPKCAGTQRLGLGVAEALANEHGGTCLSREYENSRKRLHWRCAEGHEWLTTLSSVKAQEEPVPSLQQ